MRTRSDELTKRESEVIALIVIGKRNKQISQALRISEATVENHLRHIYDKLGVSSRVEAAIRVLHAGDSSTGER